MDTLKRLYKHNLTLLTDLYELTMAYGYWKNGMQDYPSVFHLFFRKNPFNGGYAVACGLERVIEFLTNFRFDEDDMEYLNSLMVNDRLPLFDKDFLKYLKDLKFSCSINAIPEGTVVFPNEPLLRVDGPLIQAQIIESAMLNFINFETLIATKSARICNAAQGEPVLEFGLRRAQGIDGGISASRAAYIGGCAGTSNVLAGKLLDIPVKGTHAHSWVMSFDSELEAFRVYADAMPNNCIFLVDTYNTINGVKKAIEVGKELRKKGFKLNGIRLDSGDLAYLSVEAKKILDENGFEDAAIVGSNDLDEFIIGSLKQQNAKINVWGVGTKLATAFDDPALGGVYKLSAIKNGSGSWEYKVKLSDQAAKVSNPGILQVRRFYKNGNPIGDMIFDIENSENINNVIVDPNDSLRRKNLNEATSGSDLLIPIFKNGNCIYKTRDIHSIREYASRQLESFHQGIKRLHNPHEYPVGLEESLFKRKTKLILEAKAIRE